MNSLKNDEVRHNNDGQLDGQKTCQCQDKHGVFLTSRRFGWLISAVLLFCLFTFIAGYFFGKKNAVEKFYDKIEQDSFADHIYYSMCSMYDKGALEQNNGGGTEGDETTEASQPAAASTVKPADAVAQQPVVAQSTVGAEKEKVEEKEAPQYYAELVGFGTQAAAEKCAAQLKKKNITVLVKRRHSKTARGRVTTWYQVVSEMFSDKNDLLAFVDDVSARKGLKNVRIVSC